MTGEMASLFDDYADARVARDEAMQRVDEHADPDWKELALDVALRVARDNFDFTTDDVWQALGDNRPREPRALGPIMMMLSKRGVIRKTGMMRESTRPEAHMNPKAVWRFVL